MCDVRSFWNRWISKLSCVRTAAPLCSRLRTSYLLLGWGRKICSAFSVSRNKWSLATIRQINCTDSTVFGSISADDVSHELLVLISKILTILSPLRRFLSVVDGGKLVSALSLWTWESGQVLSIFSQTGSLRYGVLVTILIAFLQRAGHWRSVSRNRCRQRTDKMIFTIICFLSYWTSILLASLTSKF